MTITKFKLAALFTAFVLIIGCAPNAEGNKAEKINRYDAERDKVEGEVDTSKLYKKAVTHVPSIVAIEYGNKNPNFCPPGQKLSTIVDLRQKLHPDSSRYGSVSKAEVLELAELALCADLYSEPEYAIEFAMRAAFLADIYEKKSTGEQLALSFLKSQDSPELDVMFMAWVNKRLMDQGYDLIYSNKKKIQKEYRDQGYQGSINTFTNYYKLHWYTKHGVKDGP